MSNPILVVRDLGRGETPAVPAAQFKRGDVVKVRNRRSLAHFPREAVVAVAIPIGFPGEHALADLLGEPRPLMSTAPARVITYILVKEGDPKPYMAREGDLLPSGKEPVEIGSIARAPDPTSYPGIERAALEISYDNGGINRDRTEASMLHELRQFLASSPVPAAELQTINDWVAALSDEDLCTVCCGEETASRAAVRGSPAGTDELLNEIFEKVA